MNDVVELRALLDLAITSVRETIGAEETEPCFLSLLGYLKANPKVRAAAIVEFSKIIEQRQFAGFRPIAFCMHELRWPEILAITKRARAQAVDSMGSKYDANIQNHIFALVDLEAAFNDNWEEKDLYRHYQKPNQ